MSTVPTDLQERIRSVLSARVGEEVMTVGAEEDLAQVLGERYDSMTAMECITAIEAAFDIEVDFVAHDVRYWFSTVERMARFIRDEQEDRALLEHGR
ncbi:acyl carrier protein [Nocardiopsis deserti]|uniref:acyl carrier protein n=1 Tax=Nocardiopsis deserti TaxID=2605988 RepID=UPI001238D1AD|nr:phosphopantetheine-binding protein [Nocardiopsis deserti]